MPKGNSPRRKKLDSDAQDLVSELGITPMKVGEIAERYGRPIPNVQQILLPRAREFARANGIVIDRPVARDGFLYRARWDWTGEQRPNWSAMLSDLFSRSKNMGQDLATYTANAHAEGKTELAEHLQDIHDLFKVTTRSIYKAHELVTIS
jgi:hypothetical protein